MQYKYPSPILSIIILTGMIFLLSCNDAPQKSDDGGNIKNEVLVLGVIHGGHLKQEVYSIEVLKSLIRKIEPDIILAEIPPDRFELAVQQFEANGSISEPRVSRFPEYVDVVFPLSKEMKFEIIPTAAWTKPMADARRKKMRDIRRNKDRISDWKEYMAAGKKSDSLIKATGKAFDPYFINSDEYDAISEIELSVYNRLFNQDLGDGGWDNINRAHFAYIAAALDKHQDQGKRILIMYGAGHKGWFLRELKKREDIKLVTLQELTQ